MPLLNNPDPGLTFGPLNLIGTDAEQAAVGYKFEALAETSWGNPVPIQQKVISWLQDGALVSKTGDDNRDAMTIKVRIVGNDSNKLALGEQALVLQTGIRNTLTWTPPDGFGEPCVFDVVMSNLDYDFDDIEELYTERIYTLRLQCLPFARSQDAVTVTVPAPSGTQTLTTVDACTSFTNWAGTSPSVSGTVTSGTAGGAVFVTNTNSSASGNAVFGLRLLRTSLSASINTTPYIRVDMTLTRSNVNLTGATTPVFTLNGIVVPTAIQSGSIYWLETTGLGLGTTLTTFQVDYTDLKATVNSPNAATLAVADITRSNVIGEASTRRQLARTVAVAGSARTQGSLSVSDATNSLGSTLVYTSPAVGGLVQPNLRTFLTSGNSTTVDAANVSGLTSDLGTLHTFDIPVTGLQEGAYSLMARVKHASPGAKTVTWAARSRMGGINSTTQAGTTTITVATTFGIFDIAQVDLPPRRTGSAGLVRIELTGPASLILDEAWLFNLDTGNLTWVECGTSTPAAGGSNQNRLWIDAASLENEVPTVYTGFAADRSDQVYPDQMFSNDIHNISPQLLNVFTVTTNSTASSLSLTHNPRWHTHVAA